MINIRLLFILLLVSCSAGAAVGDLSVPKKYFMTVNSFKYYDPAAWCAADLAYKKLTDRTCINTSAGAISPSLLSQTWNYQYQITGTGQTGPSSTVSASAECETPIYQGPGPYNPADTTKYYCKQVQDMPKPCSDLNPFNRAFFYKNSPYSAPRSYAGCVVQGIELLVCRKQAAGITYCMWQLKRTGEVFNGTEDDSNGSGGSDTPEDKSNPPATSPPFSNPPPPNCSSNCSSCPAGSVQGGVDSSGITICIGTGTSPPPATTPTTTTSPPVTQTNPDGSTTTTQNTTQKNADGSTTTVTTTTVVASDGSKTVSQTSSTGQTSSGAQGKTDTPDADKNNLCKQNPTLTICGNSSVSGTCGNISCVGDAIQCATLRATAQIQCKQKQDDDELKASSHYALGSAVLNGSDPASSSLPSPSKAENVTMGAISDAGWLGGGSFFSDKNIQLPGGHSLTIPFSKAADIMIALRYIIMVAASLVSFKIIRGAFSSSGV